MVKNSIIITVIVFEGCIQKQWPFLLLISGIIEQPYSIRTFTIQGKVGQGKFSSLKHDNYKISLKHKVLQLS